MFNLSDSEWKKIQWVLSPLKRKTRSNSTASVLADALRLYAQAMDAHEEYWSFLGLWQTAEAIAALDPGGPGDVKRQMSWLSERTDLYGSGFRHLLDELSKKRNDLVHRGLHENISDDDVNVMKTVCELGIQWLRGSCGSLSTRSSLKQFYSMRQLNGAELRCLREALNLVEEEDSQPKSGRSHPHGSVKHESSNKVE